jgi:hypothetical protein
MRLSRRQPAPAAAPAPPAAGTDAELAARRDRLVEKFTVMQADLGGLFYEMAIRDHVVLDVLKGKAAELQRVDAELGQVERLLRLDSSGAAGSCPTCEALYARGAVFCAQCGHALVSMEATG